MKKAILFVLVAGFIPNLLAQKTNDAYQLNIRQATSTIKIDGIRDEAAWQNTDVAKNFRMVLPMDTSETNVKTEVRMTYDTDNLYIVADCFNGLPGEDMVESMRRDFSFGKNDNFIVFIEPFNDLTNGFAFGVNAAGAQWDGMMFEGGKVDLSWDNKWTSAVKKLDDRWVLEAAIPFTTIRYKKGVSQWGINFSRNDLKSTEKSAWAPVPRQFPTSSFAYNGNLVWDKAPPTPSVNISLIPYALTGIARNFKTDKEAKSRLNVGGDAKVALTSSLNLDLTIRPDFSQVEVDQQVTNLDRFELFFPERRQFFLENGDLFANFGYSSIRPFFSRRIGLNVPIQFGGRISGKINKNWRMGLMNMQTEKVENRGLPAQNFSVIALQRRVFSRSNIGAIFINKQSLNYKPDPLLSAYPLYNQYNRNIGLEYNLASANNIWTGKVLFLKSYSPVKKGNDMVHAANLQYNSRSWLLNWQHEYVGKNYTAEVGFVPRTGFVRLSPSVSRLFFPKSTSKVLTHGLTLATFRFYDEKLKPTDNTTYLAYNVILKNRTSMTLWVADDYVKLFQPFDPTNSGKDSLAAGTEHHWNAFGTEFTSKPQSVFTYAFSTRYGGYYADGTRLNISSELGYRFQPYASIAVSSSYNDIRMPAPLGQTTFWLVGPRVDVTMSNKLFFTGFAQYNQQQKNMNLNMRLQWRYQPVSDLFIVYTDNYLPQPFSVKNRALVLKLTYWWNV